MSRFLRILLLTCVAATSVPAAESYLLRFANPAENLVVQSVDEGRDIAAFVPGKYLDLVATEAEFGILRDKEHSFDVLESSRDITQRLGKQTAIPDVYHAYEDMWSMLQGWTTDHPDICKLYDVGDSYGKKRYVQGYSAYSDYNHDIWAVKISDTVESVEDEDQYLIMGGQVGRGAASVEVCLAVVEYLLSNYESNAEVREIVDRCEIWIIPLVNPNGHKIALDQVNNMWRKNIRDNNNDGRISSGSSGNTIDGVDLNRNYGHAWGGPGSSDNSTDQTYRGPSSFSEHELSGIKTLMDENKFIASMTTSLYSELVLIPYRYAADAEAPDEAALYDLGRDLANEMRKTNTIDAYSLQKGSSLYPAAGVVDDYAYGVNGIFSYDVKLYSNSFWPPLSALGALKDDFVEASMVMFSRSKTSALKGHVTSKLTGEPVEATVYIPAIDDTVANQTSWRAPYRSRQTFGSYCRLLLSGSYDVTFSAQGFHDTTFTGVQITDFDVTILDVEMEGTTSVSYAGTEGRTNRGPRIVSNKNGRVDFMLPRNPVNGTTRIYSLQGQLLTRSGADGTGLSWDSSSMPNGMYLIIAENGNRVR